MGEEVGGTEDWWGNYTVQYKTWEILTEKHFFHGKQIAQG